VDTSERGFEDIIEASLVAQGYRRRSSKDYDRSLCLDPELLLHFLYATQPREWEKLKAIHRADQVKEKFLRRLTSEIASRGTLDVLRNKVKDHGSTFRLAYFAPESGLNPEHAAQYQQNILSVVRQLRYSTQNDNTLDLTLFLNGVPIATAELKNHLSGQNVEDAVAQYRTDRDPREPLFAHGRCLVHFAVDDDLVYMTTELAGQATRFLPFNKGHNLGAGNPPNPAGYRTYYLWELIWCKDSLLDIFARFLHDITEEDDGKRIRRIIFPRYHQLDAVRQLVADARVTGAGKSYLVQHSAGSGKSNTIAWLCHQLAGLHDASDERVFDSTIVVTDRRVLDQQLQQTIGQFEQTEGVVVLVEKHSRELREALKSGKNVIVTTLQKFPFVVDTIGPLPGRRFAVVIDEAHSSQSGISNEKMKQVLASVTLEQAEHDEQPNADMEDTINATLAARGRLPHVSYFAFTATPKPKTLELFGAEQPDGSFLPFSHYSMRQAIEEQFILDVLENYTTYRVYFNLLKRIESDPSYDRKKATYLLRSFVGLHAHAIDKKTEIMVEHFWGNVRDQIGGQARAMVVTRSRLHAVRYKLAFDRYLKVKNYPIKALVAFSGTVRDPDNGLEYTEPRMNSEPGRHIPESATAGEFAKGPYRIMIVAEKFQTGFDQPLLHTMYVDKRLSGVNAVQTLSRLNRTYPGKTGTMVLDFENEAEEIQRSFQPYYETSILSEGTDPNKLYDLQRILLDFRVFTEADVEQLARVYFSPKGKQSQLHPILDAARTRFDYLPEEQREDFKHQLGNFVRLYAFLSQLVPFKDADLEKLYAFGRLLLTKLPARDEDLPREIAEAIDVDSYRIDKISQGKITLARERGELGPISGLGTGMPSYANLEPLSLIIQEVNERYGTEFTDADKVILNGLQAQLAGNQTLVDSAMVSSRENVRLVFDNLFVDAMQELVNSNFDLYKRVTDDADFSEFLKGRLFDLVYRRIEPPQPGA
jgi:type I restriction enzyme R subunit